MQEGNSEQAKRKLENQMKAGDDSWQKAKGNLQPRKKQPFNRLSVGFSEQIPRSAYFQKQFLLSMFLWKGSAHARVPKSPPYD